jgi:DNA-binding FrmR family transcriptional regulator
MLAALTNDRRLAGEGNQVSDSAEPSESRIAQPNQRFGLRDDGCDEKTIAYLLDHGVHRHRLMSAVAHHLVRQAQLRLVSVLHCLTIPIGGIIGPMPGYTKDKQKIETRLRRIEGQVRGIQKMVAEDRYCIDVLTQVNATRAALESVALQLLADHTEHCVAEAIRSGGGMKKVRELNDAVERLVRS